MLNLGNKKLLAIVERKCDKIIEESSEGHRKATFTMPKKRMGRIKEKETVPLSN
jgi:hypothetical protein